MSTLVFVYFPAPITLYPAFKYPTYYTSFGGCTSAPLRISVSRELRVVLEALLQTVIFFVIHWVISLMVSGGGEGGGCSFYVYDLFVFGVHNVDCSCKEGGQFGCYLFLLRHS